MDLPVIPFLLLLFTVGYLTIFVMTIIDNYELTKFQLTEHPLSFNFSKDVGQDDLSEKLSYLNKVNEVLSSHLNIKSPELFYVDNEKDQATAIRVPGLSAVVFELQVIRNLPKEDLGSVLAHEMWHLKSWHYVTDLLAYSFLKFTTPLVFLLVVSNMGSLSDTNVTIETFSWKLILAVYLYGFFFYYSGKLIDVVKLYFHRQKEVSCDLFSAETLGYENYISEAQYFKKADKRCKTDIWDSHPIWQERIGAVEKHLSRTPNELLRFEITK